MCTHLIGALSIWNCLILVEFRLSLRYPCQTLGFRRLVFRFWLLSGEAAKRVRYENCVAVQNTDQLAHACWHVPHRTTSGWAKFLGGLFPCPTDEPSYSPTVVIFECISNK